MDAIDEDLDDLGRAVEVTGLPQDDGRLDLAVIRRVMGGGEPEAAEAAKLKLEGLCGILESHMSGMGEGAKTIAEAYQVIGRLEKAVEGVVDAQPSH